MKNNKAQHTSLVFLVLFIAIVSVFTTISVVQNDNNGVPTGLVVDEQTQQTLEQQKLDLEQSQDDSCNYDSWFRSLVCNWGIESWFYQESTTIEVYTVDGDGNVIGASVIREYPDGAYIPTNVESDSPDGAYIPTQGFD